MTTILWILLLLAIVAVIVIGIFGGDIINSVLPKSYLQVGDPVEIFQDGVFDRTATISGIKSNKIYIYGSLSLPLDYRGRFYAVGEDSNGVKLWYVAKRKQYRLIPIAEKVRSVFHTMPDPYQMAPVYLDGEISSNANETIEEVKESED